MKTTIKISELTSKSWEDKDIVNYFLRIKNKEEEAKYSKEDHKRYVDKLVTNIKASSHKFQGSTYFTNDKEYEEFYNNSFLKDK